jgi:glycosyltransferase involved in cell wall biosynthesis
MQRLRILFICSWYPNKSDAYIGNFVQRHALAAARYADVYTLSAHEAEEASTAKTEYEGVRETRVYFKKRVPLVSYRQALKKGYKQLINEYGAFNLIHTHVVYPAATLSNALDIPSLVSEHFSGYHPISGHKWTSLSKSIAQKALKRAKYVLPVSDHLGAAIQRFEPTAETQKVSNAVDTEIFKPRLRNTETACHFLHVSTLEERSKNISGLLDAFKVLQDEGIDFHLSIGGDGDIEKLKKDIETIGLLPKCITIFGATNSAGIAELMQQTDCFVLSSNFENQPCVILEALCCGTPIISSKVGGISEEVNEANGILYPAGDHTQLATALQRFCEKEVSFDHQQIAAKAQAQYSLDAIGEKLHNLYLNALK